MNLSHLKYFISLADSKHFANTAKSLSIARSTLSLAISNLEQDLGAPCSPKRQHIPAYALRQGILPLRLPCVEEHRDRPPTRSGHGQQQG